MTCAERSTLGDLCFTRRALLSSLVCEPLRHLGTCQASRLGNWKFSLISYLCGITLRFESFRVLFILSKGLQAGLPDGNDTAPEFHLYSPGTMNMVRYLRDKNGKIGDYCLDYGTVLLLWLSWDGNTALC